MSQISHIKYKDIIEAWRFDADFFRPDFIKLENTLKRNNCDYLKDYCYFVKKGIFDISPLKYKTKWVPFLRVSNTKSFFINTSDLVFLDEETHNENKWTELNLWDIALSKVWTIGDAVINLDYEKVNISQNNIWIKIKHNLIDSWFIVAFLNSKYGKGQIKKKQSWQVQEKLVLDDIKYLQIPRIDNEKEIWDFIRLAYDKLWQSKQLYQDAEDLLLTELWLKEHTISHTLTFSTTKKAVDEAWRYDADYFQPKYDELIKKIENYKWGWEYVENCIKVQDKNFIPEKWKLYKYIALANVSAQWFISDCEENYWENLPTRARRILHKWDVIVSSIEWSLSSCAVIEDEFDWWLCSNWFYVLNSNFFNSECLLVLFKSNIIQTLLKKWCSWTILTAISKDELNKIKIPLINPQLQKEISDKIKESFKLRNESKELLEQAKKMVEDEIEKE